jgi:glycosyltransferase involved in cell wall biosynthesis
MDTAVFICRGIRNIENTTQYQRANSILDKYNVHFLLQSNQDQLPKDINRQAAGIHSYPDKMPSISILFSLWALTYTLYINSSIGVKIIYTTNVPSYILSGYLLQKAGFIWISDIYDHPLLGIDIAISNGVKGEYNLYNKLNAKLVKIALASPPDLMILALHENIIESNDIFPEKNRLNLLNTTNGVDCDLVSKAQSQFANKYQQRQDVYSITYVGPVQASRNVSTIIEAAEKLGQLDINFKINLVGPVFDDRLVDNLASEKLKNKIETVGEVKHRKALKKIYQSDICLCTLGDLDNHKYSYPIKLFEYMSFGKPIIATDYPGITNIIQHGRNGLTVSPGASDELAEELIRLCRDDELRSTLGKQAKTDVQKYSWKSINQTVIKAISEVNVR